MDMNSVVQVVQSVGFPIVCCGAMGWFVYFMYNKNQEQIATMTEQHRNEIIELQQAIDNNTIALTKLIDSINYLNKGSDENEEDESE